MPLSQCLATSCALPAALPAPMRQPCSSSNPSWRQHFKQKLRTPPLAVAVAVQHSPNGEEVPRLDAELDDRLSQRPLALDAAGYFIIQVDIEARELVADFYTNTINEQGLACDPATGQVISCKPGTPRLPVRTWRGRTAKQLSVDILEADHGFKPVTHLEHANYLGRELQRAEFALLSGQRYVQD